MVDSDENRSAEHQLAECRKIDSSAQRICKKQFQSKDGTIKACSDRLFTTGSFAGSGPRTPAASEFRSSIVGKSDFSGPQAALDDQNSLLLSPIPKVLLPHQRSLQEPCSKGVAWDLKFAAFGRHSAAVARHLNAKQLALSVMLFRSSSLLLFSTLRR